MYLSLIFSITYLGGAIYLVFSGQIFCCFFVNYFFFIDVAMCDLVHDVKIIHSPYQLLTASGYPF